VPEVPAALPPRVPLLPDMPVPEPVPDALLPLADPLLLPLSELAHPSAPSPSAAATARAETCFRLDPRMRHSFRKRTWDSRPEIGGTARTPGIDENGRYSTRAVRRLRFPRPWNIAPPGSAGERGIAITGPRV
jgi:hypothetical protein